MNIKQKTVMARKEGCKERSTLVVTLGNLLEENVTYCAQKSNGVITLSPMMIAPIKEVN